MNKQALKNLYKMSPVPVYEVNMDMWAAAYPARFDYILGGTFDGVCVELTDDCKFPLPKKFILIKESRPNYHKAAVFMHELGHVCQPPRKNGQFTQKARDEVKAETFAMKMLLRFNLILSARLRLGNVMGWASSLDTQSEHDVAGRLLMKNKTYRKMVKTVLFARKSKITLAELDRRIAKKRRSQKNIQHSA